MRDVYHCAIRPAYDLLPGVMSSYRATVELLAIGLQESKLIYRRQMGGPARGLWQFERGGGTFGVLTHPASAEHALHVCHALGVPAATSSVYEALEFNDVLAAAFARLLLWTDPRPLPTPGDEDGAYQYYDNLWRPGKKRPKDWPKSYNDALAFAPEK